MLTLCSSAFHLLRLKFALYTLSKGILILLCLYTMYLDLANPRFTDSNPWQRPHTKLLMRRGDYQNQIRYP